MFFVTFVVLIPLQTDMLKQGHRNEKIAINNYDLIPKIPPFFFTKLCNF
jgi:hypothetical protein